MIVIIENIVENIRIPNYRNKLLILEDKCCVMLRPTTVYTSSINFFFSSGIIINNVKYSFQPTGICLFNFFLSLSYYSCAVNGIYGKHLVVYICPRHPRYF